jgi:acetate---CoA ligase (ADP-forming)
MSAHQTAIGYFKARQILEAAGITFPKAVAVRSLDEAVLAASSIGFPIVLKATDPLHKSDVDGVHVGICNEAELSDALIRMSATVRTRTYSVEQHITASERGVEMLVGARRDPSFGPVVLLGLGGVYAEVLGDHTVELAPVDSAQARAMIDRLKVAPMLYKYRNRAALDLRAISESVVTFSQVVMRHAWIYEIEVNPLLCSPTGVVALDARILTTTEGDGPPEQP